MLVGYMRVSNSDYRQSVDLQRDALAAADERRLQHDRASGSKDDQPGLKTRLVDIHSGNVLITFVKMVRNCWVFTVDT